jgi:hypothetical protein
MENMKEITVWTDMAIGITIIINIEIALSSICLWRAVPVHPQDKKLYSHLGFNPLSRRIAMSGIIGRKR